MISIGELAQRMDPVRTPTRLAGDPSAWPTETDPKVWLKHQEIVDVVVLLPQHTSR